MTLIDRWLARGHAAGRLEGPARSLHRHPLTIAYGYDLLLAAIFGAAWSRRPKSVLPSAHCSSLQLPQLPSSPRSRAASLRSASSMNLFLVVKLAVSALPLRLKAMKLPRQG